MRIRVLVALLVLLGAPLVSPLTTRAALDHCLIYRIDATIDLGAAPLTRSGTLVVFPEPVITATGTDTPANLWEFWLQIGEPATSPTPGAIYLATNGAIVAPGGTMAAAQLQLADITWNAAGYYEAVPRVYEAQQFVNIFTISDGILATPYTISSGAIQLAFSEDRTQLQATIDLLGRSIYAFGFSADMPYRATVAGTFDQESDRCFSPGR